MMSAQSKLLSILLIFSPSLIATDPPLSPHIKHPTPIRASSSRDVSSLTEMQKALLMQRRRQVKEKADKEKKEKELLFRQEQRERQDKRREEYWRTHSEENE